MTTQTKQTTKMAADMLEARKWFNETFDQNERSPERIQILILFKLHQLERALEDVSKQTRMHWTN